MGIYFQKWLGSEYHWNFIMYKESKICLAAIFSNFLTVLYMEVYLVITVHIILFLCLGYVCGVFKSIWTDQGWSDLGWRLGNITWPMNGTLLAVFAGASHGPPAFNLTTYFFYFFFKDFLIIGLIFTHFFGANLITTLNFIIWCHTKSSLFAFSLIILMKSRNILDVILCVLTVWPGWFNWEWFQLRRKWFQPIHWKSATSLLLNTSRAMSSVFWWNIPMVHGLLSFLNQYLLMLLGLAYHKFRRAYLETIGNNLEVKSLESFFKCPGIDHLIQLKKESEKVVIMPTLEITKHNCNKR